MMVNFSPEFSLCVMVCVMGTQTGELSLTSNTLTVTVPLSCYRIFKAIYIYKTALT